MTATLPTPKGYRFFNEYRKQEMILCADPKNIWNGWLMVQKPDGHWAPLRLAEPEDQRDAQPMTPS